MANGDDTFGEFKLEDTSKNNIPVTPDIKVGAGEFTVDTAKTSKIANDPLMQMAQLDDLRDKSTVDASKFEGLIKTGVFDNPALERTAALNQSTAAKWTGFLDQAVIGEILGGTISGIGATWELMQSGVDEAMNGDADFSNFMIELGDSIQQGSKERSPIYQLNPGETFQFRDWGWWAQNAVSVVSTLSLMIPAAGTVRGAGFLGRLAGVSNKLGKGTKALLKTGLSAGVMRNAENFRESFQIVKDIKADAMAQFENMDDEAFNEFLQTDVGKEFLAEGRAPDREELSNFIAAKAGWRSYAVNSVNIVFDFMQASVMFKGMGRATRTNPRGGSSKVAKASGKTRTASQRAMRMFHPIVSPFARQATEGIEEGINFIGGEEGKHYGKKLLGEDDGTTIADRLSKYIQDDHMHESMFWGVLGGVAFEQTMSFASKGNNKAQEENKLEEIRVREKVIRSGAAAMEKIRASYNNQEISYEQAQESMRETQSALAFNLGLNASKVGNVDILLEQLETKEFEAMVLKNYTQAELKELGADGIRKMMKGIRNDIEAAESSYKKIFDRWFNVDGISEAAKDKLIETQLDTVQEQRRHQEGIDNLNKKMTELRGSSAFQEIAAQDEFESTLELEATREAIRNLQGAIRQAEKNSNFSMLADNGKKQLDKLIAREKELVNSIGTRANLSGLNSAVLTTASDLILRGSFKKMQEQIFQDNDTKAAAEKAEKEVKAERDKKRKEALDKLRKEVEDSVAKGSTVAELEAQLETVKKKGNKEIESILTKAIAKKKAEAKGAETKEAVTKEREEAEVEPPETTTTIPDDAVDEVVETPETKEVPATTPEPQDGLASDEMLENELGDSKTGYDNVIARALGKDTVEGRVSELKKLRARIKKKLKLSDNSVAIKHLDALITKEENEAREAATTEVPTEEAETPAPPAAPEDRTQAAIAAELGTRKESFDITLRNALALTDPEAKIKELQRLRKLIQKKARLKDSSATIRHLDSLIQEQKDAIKATLKEVDQALQQVPAEQQELPSKGDKAEREAAEVKGRIEVETRKLIANQIRVVDEVSISDLKKSLYPLFPVTDKAVVDEQIDATIEQVLAEGLPEFNIASVEKKGSKLLLDEGQSKEALEAEVKRRAGEQTPDPVVKEELEEKEPAPSNEEKPQTELEKAKAKQAASLAKLRAKLKGKGLTSGGLDPEIIEAAGELIADTIKLGVVGFKNIVRDIKKNYGDDIVKEIFEGLKGGYAFLYATNKIDRSNDKDLNEVDSVTLDEILNEDVQTQEKQPLERSEEAAKSNTHGNANIYAVGMFLGLVRDSNGDYIIMDEWKDSYEAINDENFNVGSTVTLEVDEANQFHKDTMEDLAIAIKDDKGRLVGYINNVHSVQSQLDKALAERKAGKQVSDKWISTLENNLAAALKIRNKIFADRQAGKKTTYTSTITKLTSGASVRPRTKKTDTKDSQPVRRDVKEVFGEDPEIYFVDPMDKNSDRVTELVSGDGDKFFQGSNPRDSEGRPPKGYKKGAFYIMTNGFNGKKVPVRVRVNTLSSESVNEVAVIMKEIMDMLKRPSQEFGLENQEFRAKLAELQSIIFVNQKEDKNINFKVNRYEIAFTYPNDQGKTVTVRIFTRQYDRATKKLLPLKGFRMTVEAPGVDKITRSSVTSREGFNSELKKGLSRKLYNVDTGRLQPSHPKFEDGYKGRVLEEGRLVAETGVVKDEDGNKMGNFIHKETALQGDTNKPYGQSYNLVMQVSDEITGKEEEVKEAPKEETKVPVKVVTQDVNEKDTSKDKEGKAVPTEKPPVTVKKEKSEADKLAAKKRALDAFNKNSNGMSFMSAVPEDAPAEVEGDTEANRQANWKRMFGDHIPLDTNIDELIRFKGQYAYALFHDAMGFVSKKAPKGEEYHEAFHVAMHIYLTEEQRTRIYDEARKKYKGTPRFKKQLERSKGDEIKALEELLADDFKEYSLLRSQGIKPKQPNLIRQFFDGLRNFINRLLGRYSIEQVFKGIYGGNFNYKPDARSIEYAKGVGLASAADPINLDFTNQEQITYTNILTRMVGEFINTYPFVTKEERDADPEKYDVEFITKSRLEQYVEFGVEMMGATQEQVDEVQRILDNWGDNKTGFWKLTLDSVKRNLGTTIHYDEEIDTETSGLTKAWDDRLAFQRSSKESFNADLKRLIMTTPEIASITPVIDEQGNVRHQPISKKEEKTGLTPALNFDKVYPYLQRIMSGANTVSEMMARLQVASKANPSFALIAQRLEADTNLKAAWFFNFNRPIMDTVNYQLTDSKEKTKIKRDVSNKKASEFAISNVWVNGIKLRIDSNYYDASTKKTYQRLIDGRRKDVLTADQFNADDAASVASDILSVLGISMPADVLKNVIENPALVAVQGSPRKVFDNVVMRAIKNMGDGVMVGVGTEAGPKFDNFGDLNRLAKLVSWYTLDMMENSYLNVSGNNVSSIDKPSYISNFYRKIEAAMDDLYLNKNEAQGELLNLLKQYARDPSMKHSNWLWNAGKGKGKGGMLTLTGGERNIENAQLNRAFLRRFNINAFDGLKNLMTRNGQEYSDLSPRDWRFAKLINYLTTDKKGDFVGNFILAQPDSSKRFSLTVPKFKLLNKDGVVARDTALFNALKNTIRQEMQRMNQARNHLFTTAEDGITMIPRHPDELNYRELQMYYHYGKRDIIKPVKRRGDRSQVVGEVDPLADTDADYLAKIQEEFKENYNIDIASIKDYEKWLGHPVTLRNDGKGNYIPTGNVFNFHNMSIVDTDGSYGNKGNVVFMDSISGLLTNGVWFKEHFGNELNEAVETFIDTFIKQQADIGRKNYEQHQGLLEKGGLLDKYSTFDQFVTEYTLNQYLSNVEQYNFFQGSIAEYSSKVDTNKRAKELTSPKQTGSGLFLAPTFKAVTVRDVMLRSRSYDKMANAMADILKAERPALRNLSFNLDNVQKRNPSSNANALEKAVHKIVQPYQSIETSDAQGYVTVERYKNILKDFGRWTPKMEHLFNIVEGTERDLTPVELNSFLEVLKPFYYGRDFDHGLNKMSSAMIKYSAVPLIPQLTKGTDLDAIREYMEDNDVGEIHFLSGHKMGAKDVQSLTDETALDFQDAGRLDPNFADRLSPRTYYSENWGIQLDVPNHMRDTTNRLGTQISKLMIANLSTDRIYQLGGETFTGSELKNEYFEILQANIEESSRDLLAKIGAVEKEDGTFVINDITGIQEILADELNKRGLSANYMEAIKLIEDVRGEKQFNLPLYFSAMSNKFESILTSLFTNNVTRQKFTGAHAVLVSDAFVTNVTQLEGAGEEVGGTPAETGIDWVKEKREKNNFKLNFQVLEKDGVKVIEAEALVPAWSKQFYQEGERISIDQLPEDLRTMIHHRIPTEAKRSILVFKVVGFLPDANGSSIIVPPEVITQSGSDFDIDSSYMLMHHFDVNVDESGNRTFTKAKYLDDSNSTIKERLVTAKAFRKENSFSGTRFENFFNAEVEDGTFTFGKDKVERKLSQVEKDSINSLIFSPDINVPFNIPILGFINKTKFKELGDIVEEGDVKIAKLIKTILQRYNPIGKELNMEAFEKLSMVKQNTKRARENRMLDLYMSILTNPRHYRELITPADFADMTAAQKEQKDIYKMDDNSLNPSTDDGQLHFRDTEIAGRNLKGQAANSNGILPVFQQTQTQLRQDLGIDVTYSMEGMNEQELKDKYGEENVVMNDNGTVTITHTRLGWNADGSYTNVEGDFITDHASQSLANILDIVKEGIPLNINNYTFNSFQVMLNVGIPIRYAAHFTRQPIIKTIADIALQDKGITATSKRREFETTKRLFQTVLITELDRLGALPKTKAVDSALRSIGKINSSGKFTKTEGRTLFLKRGVTEEVLGYNPDEAYAPTVEELVNMMEQNKKFTDIGRANFTASQRAEYVEYLRNQLKILERYRNYKKAGDAMNEGISIIAADKIGSGPALEKTLTFRSNIKAADQSSDIVKVSDTEIKRLGARLLIGDISMTKKMYPSEFGKESLAEGEIQVTESVYQPMEDYLQWSNKVSFEVLSPMFIQQSAGFKQAYLNIEKVVPKRLNERTTKLITSFLKAAMMRNNGFFTSVRGEEKARILGINTTPVIDLNVGLEEFKTLSTANKLWILKQKLADELSGDVGNLMNYLGASLDKDAIDRNGFSLITLNKPRSADNLDDALTDSFRNMYFSQDPFVRDFASDLFKYEFATNYFNFGINSISGYLPTELLVDESLVDIAGELRHMEAKIKDNRNFFSENMPNYVDTFIRNNWNNQDIVPRVATNWKLDAKGRVVAERDAEGIEIEGTRMTESGTPVWNISNNSVEVPLGALWQETTEIKITKYIVVRRQVGDAFEDLLFKRSEFSNRVIAGTLNSNNGKISKKDSTPITYLPVDKLSNRHMAVEFTKRSAIPSNNVTVQITEEDIFGLEDPVNENPFDQQNKGELDENGTRDCK